MKSRMKLVGGLSAVAFGLALSAPGDASALSKDGDHYHLDGAVAPGCKAGVECTVTIKINGKGGFHVNTEFPTTFKLAKQDDKAPALTMVGSPTANVTEGGGTVVAKVKVNSGNAINGTAKFAVCSDDKKQCEPNNVDFAFTF
jgi:hypothetical protein